MKTTKLTLVQFYDNSFDPPVWKVKLPGIDKTFMCLNTCSSFTEDFQGKEVEATIEIAAAEGTATEASPGLEIVKQCEDLPNDGAKLKIVGRFIGMLDDDPEMPPRHLIDFNGVPLYADFELLRYRCPVAPGEMIEVTGLMEFSAP